MLGLAGDPTITMELPVAEESIVAHLEHEAAKNGKKHTHTLFVSLSLSLSLSLSVFCGERERESRLASGVSVLVRYVIMCCTSILP